MLSGKKIVIIGGTSGIGLSAALAFLKNGASVVVVGKGDESCGNARQALGKATCVLEGDAVQEATAQHAIEICIKKFGGFDGLYHVAGGSGRRFGDGPLHELTPDAWRQTLDLNLTSVMLSNRAAVRRFLESGKGGSILNLSSVLAFSPAPQFFSTHAYAAAKAAIIGFSKSIAAFYAGNNIRVNVLCPALVETPMSQRAVANDQILSFVQKKQPLDGGRVGQPGDLDGMASLLLSDAGAFITGQVISVDGGWSVSGV